MMNKGKLIIVSGPSGAGKGTVLQEVFKQLPDLKYSISATTRKPREGETNGVQYFFITKAEFKGKIKRGEMLEYAWYCNNYYGTPADYVETHRSAGNDVLLEIEPQGAIQVMKKCSDAISVFVMPPSLEELEKRLVGRGTESAEIVAERIAQAKKEIANSHLYDFTVVNDDILVAAEQIIEIIKK